MSDQGPNPIIVPILAMPLWPQEMRIKHKQINHPKRLNFDTKAQSRTLLLS